MLPTDDVRRWSDELARDPSSLVFVPLGDALRRQGELAVALKVALRGLERHPGHTDAQDLIARIQHDREARTAPPTTAARVAAQAADIKRENEGVQHILVDEQGFVIAGAHVDIRGDDVAQDVASHLGAIADDARLAARHLGLGKWTTLVVESDAALAALAPVGDDGHLAILTAPRSVHGGMVRRLLTQWSNSTAAWLAGGAA